MKVPELIRELALTFHEVIPQVCNFKFLHYLFITRLHCILFIQIERNVHVYCRTTLTTLQFKCIIHYRTRYSFDRLKRVTRQCISCSGELVTRHIDPRASILCESMDAADVSQGLFTLFLKHIAQREKKL